MQLPCAIKLRIQAIHQLYKTDTNQNLLKHTIDYNRDSMILLAHNVFHEATYIIRKIHDKLVGLAVQMKYMLVSYSILTCIHDKVYKLNILSYSFVRAEAIKLCIAITHAKQSYKQN